MNSSFVTLSPGFFTLVVRARVGVYVYVCVILTVLWVEVWSMIVAFPGHIRLCFFWLSAQ